MEVSKLTYESRMAELRHLRGLCKLLQRERDELAETVEMFGIHQNPYESSMFSKKEVMTLILLCHPDRHRNSKASTEMTQKLLKLR